ncbi:Uncharacterised protein [uncultured Clostridium sp.]|jgi:hypothetical protein|nr:Uncharacterised protein [uncultured Clostridium sp.]
MSIEGRIRELKRLILHQRNETVRKIYEEHIKFLKTQI